MNYYLLADHTAAPEGHMVTQTGFIHKLGTFHDEYHYFILSHKTEGKFRLACSNCVSSPCKKVGETARNVIFITFLTEETFLTVTSPKDNVSALFFKICST